MANVLASPAEHDAETAANKRRALEVLLVEDNPGDARLIRESLAVAPGNSFALTHVSLLGEAVGLCRQRAFDAILLDLALPDAWGLDTVRRTRDAAGRTPIVVMTGNTDNAIAHQALLSGAQDYVIKGHAGPGALARILDFAIARNHVAGDPAALCDPLTGMHRTAIMEDRLSRAMAYADHHDYFAALLTLDLDGLRNINATYGSEVGDGLLVELAQRLQSCVRAFDTVVRAQEDGFLVLLEGIERVDEISAILGRILELMRVPYYVRGIEVSITGSVGAAVYPLVAGAALRASSGAALLDAKQSGGDCWCLYHDGDRAGTTDARAITATEPAPSQPQGIFTAEIGSAGTVSGPCRVLRKHRLRQMIALCGARHDYTDVDLRRAIQASDTQLGALKQRARRLLSADVAEIFEAQRLMLADASFGAAIIELSGKGTGAVAAILAVRRALVRCLRVIQVPHLGEKSHDIDDLTIRLLCNLYGKDPDLRPGCGRHIVIARDVYPTDIIAFALEGVQAVVLIGGGVVSHVAVLAQSLRLPLVIAQAPELLELPDLTTITLDDHGNISTHLPATVTRVRRRSPDRHRPRPASATLGATATLDGTALTLLASINLLKDARRALASHAEGVGLYRTEFLFMARSTPPTEEEQVAVYRQLFNAFPDSEVTVRTLDIGGDKPLPWMPGAAELNPAMGQRSLRLCLQHRDLFRQHLSAILRAGAGANLHIMFPMVSSLDEFRAARAVVEECVNELAATAVLHHPRPAIGMMVEVPAIIEVIDEAAEEADFLCVGTNDLTQFLFAADRTNERVSSYFVECHPALLRTLDRIARAAARHHTRLSICTDLTRDLDFVAILIGLGYRRLSVDSEYLPRLRDFLAATDLRDARRLARELLRARTCAEVRERLARSPAGVARSKRVGGRGHQRVAC